MAKNAYPTADDLCAVLTAAGLTVQEPIQDNLTALKQELGLCAAAAISDFQRDACTKFIGSGTATRVFDFPTRYIDSREIIQLDRPIATSPAPVVVFLPWNSQVPTTWVAEQDYDFLPYNAPNDGYPYTDMALYWHRGLEPLGHAYRRSIQITGNWYWGSVPDGAWLGIRARGLWLASAVIQQLGWQGVYKWVGVDGVSETSPAEPLKALRRAWGGDDPAGNSGQYGNQVLSYKPRSF